MWASNTMRWEMGFEPTTFGAAGLCWVLVLANFAVFSRVRGTDNGEQMRSSASALEYSFAYTLPRRPLHRRLGLLGRSLDAVLPRHGDFRMAQNHLNHHILNADRVQVRRKTAKDRDETRASRDTEHQPRASNGIFLSVDTYVCYKKYSYAIERHYCTHMSFNENIISWL